MILPGFNIKEVVFIIAVVSLSIGGAVIAVGQDLVPAINSTVRSVVIDPGHGGSDYGAIGSEGTAEKDVTLALARMMASELETRYTVLLTRTGDYQVDIADRTAMANHNHADLFISLHVGGGFSMQYSAVTVYLLDAADQNDADISGTDLSAGRSYIIWDEAHYGHHRLGKAFASLMEPACKELFGNCCRVKTSSVSVLQGANMPAVMVEIGCLTNSSWEKQFRSPDYLAAMSNMIGGTIERFFQSDQPGAGDRIDY